MTRLFALFLILTMTACLMHNSNDENKLIGKWKMTSYYADIGDGKENWQAADEQRQRNIEFKKNGEFVDSENDQLTRFILKDSTHIVASSKDGLASFVMTIIQLTNKELHLRPNCIEGCGEKYVRVN
jgi:hypothetical protein